MAEREKPKGTGERGFTPRAYATSSQPGAKGMAITPEGVFAFENGEMRTIFDAVDLFWAAAALDPAAWVEGRLGYDYLIEHATAATREDLRRTLNWMELAIARRDRAAVCAAARYLKVMPSTLLAEDCIRLTGIFNSRILGMVWQVTPDLDIRPLPPRIPKFGQEAGFGLIRSVPEIYEKLAMLAPDAEDIVAGLAREALDYNVSLPPSLAALAKPQAATE